MNQKKSYVVQRMVRKQAIMDALFDVIQAYEATEFDELMNAALYKNPELFHAMQTLIREVDEPRIKVYDGCSGGMSAGWRWLFRRDPPWERCCDLHDQPYARGGTKEERIEADLALMVCVARNGHPIWAVLMWIAVRIGGHPALPLPWRWGFKLPYYTPYQK
jgi:hypothetical protein